ncbi:MAG: phosphoenolpyruvate synthase [Patescibacteria group bacterium]
MAQANCKKKPLTREKRNILWFKDISIKDVGIVGGKNASLGEMYSNLTEKGIIVPNGFAVTANVYWSFLKVAGLNKRIKKAIKNLDVSDVRELARVGKEVREMILEQELPGDIKKQIIQAYHKLSDEVKKKNTAVAVRSSATAEDLPDASFAGQQETYLNLIGEEQVLKGVKKCIASLFTNRAISYREGAGFDNMEVALSVTVQQMAHAEHGASGVLFTLDTESGFRGVVLINAAYGLGEYVVQGRVTPDQYYVFKEGVRQGKQSIISKILGSKEVKLIYAEKGGVKQAIVKQSDRDKFAIEDKDVYKLAQWAMIIEDHYGKPMDIEWVKDGRNGKLYIVQARPETVKARADHNVIEKYQLKQDGKLLAGGMAIGNKIGAGKVRIIENPKQMRNFKPGEVLVTRITDPDWEPIMRIAGAIVTEQGGKTSHAAIVSRELGVPAVVGASGARKKLHQGNEVTVDCSKGDEGRVLKGILPFEVKKIVIKDVGKLRTKISMNIGDPEHAFDLSFLPHDGVGLARLEFIFSNFIKIHPLALIHYDKLKDQKAKKKIREMTRGYEDKKEFCVDKLAQGVARIATAFYPKEVVVRMSDFKTNEYSAMIGGKDFEPREENPMIGWRGASRYYSKEYREAFKLECEAVKRARNDWGLANIVPMIPFCRTPEEGEKVVALMKEWGLEQGKNGLKIYVMCEIPSNVILAEEFAKIFDGFSIGSNDLTQLTLAVDRDSGMLTNLADPNNPAVKKLISDVIKVAKKHNKYIGICGQAPSDYPEFAEFLVGEGIESISLNPDTLVETRQRIAQVEKTIGNTGNKSNPKILSLVAILGILGAGLIGLGAGCAEALQPYNQIPRDTASTLAPALLRESAVKRANELVKEASDALKNKMVTLTENTFANFTIQYPASWSVEHWQGGVALADPGTGEFISVSKQLLGHPVDPNAKLKVNVDGIDSLRFADVLPEDGKRIEVIEVPLPGGGILEINGYAERFDEILNSLKFKNDGELPDRPITHWDVREKRACIQVITYARQSGSGKCQMFSTPCDVPEGWTVCDEDDS